MAIMITGNFGPTAFHGATARAFNANSNHAPTGCDGAITSDHALNFLRGIASVT